MFKRAKPIVDPILLSSKIGFRAAKFGIKLAKKPIKRVISGEPEKVVTEIEIEDLKRMMINAARKIVLHQEEINKINVFPVADKDTGYNLAATLLGVEGAIDQKEYESFLNLTKAIKEGAMVNARGNAGMILTGYLICVLGEVKNLKSINSQRLALAMKKGIRAAHLSIAEPVEGTILDVIKAAGETAYQTAKFKKEKNVIGVLTEAKKEAEVALRETKEKLKVLKENNVVDAGALGFTKILEAWIESLKGIDLPSEAGVNRISATPEKEEDSEYRFELIFRVKTGKKQMEPEKLKNQLKRLGGSLDLIELDEQVKIHIHTNSPEKIKEKIKKFEILEWKVEDLFPVVAKVAKKTPLGLVIGQTANLPKEFLEKYEIEEVPFFARFPDGEILSRENIFPKMREAVKIGRSLPTSSTPSFNDFLLAYQRALAKFKEILVITVPSRVSGTYSQARIGRSLLSGSEKEKVTVFDCFTIEAGEAVVAIYTQELICQGKKLEEILELLKTFCPKVRVLIGIDDFRYIVHGGRLKLPKILIPPLALIKKMGVWLLIQVKDGEVKFFGIRFGKNLAKILAEEVEKEMGHKACRVVVSHADSLIKAKELKNLLLKRPKTEVLFISEVSAAIGTHTGPGALIVAFHPVYFDSADGLDKGKKIV